MNPRTPAGDVRAVVDDGTGAGGDGAGLQRGPGDEAWIEKAKATRGQYSVWDGGSTAATSLGMARLLEGAGARWTRSGG